MRWPRWRKEDVPDSVRRAYGIERLEFGREYLIPKPFDPRVLVWEASAVAEAAIETGVAQQVLDIGDYREQLERRLGKAREVMRIMINKAQRQPKRIVFPEGEEDKILRAAKFWWTRRSRRRFCSATRLLIRERLAELHLHVMHELIVDPATVARTRQLRRRALPAASAERASRSAKPKTCCSTARSSARSWCAAARRMR